MTLVKVNSCEGFIVSLTAESSILNVTLGFEYAFRILDDINQS